MDVVVPPKSDTASVPRIGATVDFPHMSEQERAMNIVDAAAKSADRTATSNGPTVGKVLTTDGPSPVTVMQVTLPAGGHMGEHDHGRSEVVIVPVQGQVRLRHEETEHDLLPGRAAHIGVGERISLTNSSTGSPATLFVTVIPPAE
jgi:quercetin dioxygenase-like cupin family protein